MRSNKAKEYLYSELSKPVNPFQGTLSQKYQAIKEWQAKRAAELRAKREKDS